MIKKIFSLLLVLTMLFSLFPVCAFAADTAERSEAEAAEFIEELLDELLDIAVGDVDSFGRINPIKLKLVRKYTSFGDSTVFGYGLDNVSGKDDAFRYHYGYGVLSDGITTGNGEGPGKAYPLLLAEKLNIRHEAAECESPYCSAMLYMDCNTRSNHFAQQAMGLLRPEDFLAILKYDADDLKPFIEDEFLSRTYFGKYILRDTTNKYSRCYSYGRPGESAITDSFLSVKENYIKNIKNSDLITLSIGGNSMSSFVRFLTQNSDIGEELLDYELSKYIPSTKLLNYYLDKMNSLLDKLGVEIGSDMEVAGMNIRKGLVKYLLYTYLGISTNTIKIADEMHRLNKHAIIVLTGPYNPLDAITMELGDSGVTVKIGKLACLLTNKITKALRNHAKKNSSYCCFVNIQAAELISDSTPVSIEMMVNGLEEFFLSNGLNAHESAKGHEYIAEEIYKTLKGRSCILR